MSGRSLSMAGLAILMGAGCSNPKTEVKIQESASLVEQRTGRKPEWKAAWDTRPPTWSDQEVLLLDEAIATALRNNRELRADLEMIGQANADLLQAGLLQNPTFNLMVMFPDGGGRSMLRGNGFPMMPLQDIWLIPPRRKAANERLQQSVLRVADQAVQTTAEVKKVYARLQYTQRAIELIRDNMQIVDQSTRIIRVRQTAGKATQVEVNLSEIRYMRLNSELIAMEAEHRASQRELLMLMGVAAGGDQWKVQPIEEDPQDSIAGADEMQLVGVAGEQRLDLKAAQWEVQAAESEITVMTREGWPMLAAGFSFERAPAPGSNNQKWSGKAGNYLAQDVINKAYGMPAGAPMVQPFSPKMREVKWTLGPMFEMSLPIFDWGQAKVARAKSMYRQRLAEYENKFQELIRMVRDKLVMLRQSHDQVEFYKNSILPAVLQNLDVARRSYIAGQEDLTIYLDVQEDVLMTRLKMVEYVRDYLVNRAELEREMGGRLEVPAGIATQPEGSTTQPATSTRPE